MDASLAQKNESKSEGFRFSETGNHFELRSGTRIAVKNSCIVNVKVFGMQSYVKMLRKK